MRSVITEFVKSVNYARSVDWYLVKLGSAIIRLEHASFKEDEANELIKRFLSNQSVKEALKPLACYMIEVEALLNNPRHKALEPYRDMIIETLRNIRCEGGNKIKEIARKPTYQIVKEEAIMRKRRKPTLLPTASRMSYDWIKIIGIAAVAMIALAAIVSLVIGLIR